MRRKGVVLLLGWLLAGVALAQGELYRYVNDQGVVVLDSQGVPPEYVAAGYQVLDVDGRVLRVVPPAPSAEELRQQAEAERQARADAQLRQRYSSLEDLDRARRHQLRDLDAAIDMARSNLQGLDGQLQALERQAAERQRAGQALSASLEEQISTQRALRQRSAAELQRREAQRQAVDAEFAAERRRLGELLGER